MFWCGRRKLLCDPWSWCGRLFSLTPASPLRCRPCCAPCSALLCFPPQYMGCIEVLRSMRSLDFNTRTQVTRYGPAVQLSPTPVPPQALGCSLCREGNRGQGEPCPAGPTLNAGTWTKGTAADQWVERGEGRWPQLGLRTTGRDVGQRCGEAAAPGAVGTRPHRAMLGGRQLGRAGGLQQ